MFTYIINIFKRIMVFTNINKTKYKCFSLKEYNYIFDIYKKNDIDKSLYKNLKFRWDSSLDDSIYSVFRPSFSNTIFINSSLSLEIAAIEILYQSSVINIYKTNKLLFIWIMIKYILFNIINTEITDVYANLLYDYYYEKTKRINLNELK